VGPCRFTEISRLSSFTRKTLQLELPHSGVLEEKKAMAKANELSCPACGDALHRSRRRGLFERVILRLVFIRPLRCHRCQLRFFSPPIFLFRDRKKRSGTD
jgi:hypothetical protein